MTHEDIITSLKPGSVIRTLQSWSDASDHAEVGDLWLLTREMRTANGFGRQFMSVRLRTRAEHELTLVADQVNRSWELVDDHE